MRMPAAGFRLVDDPLRWVARRLAGPDNNRTGWRAAVYAADDRAAYRWRRHWRDDPLADALAGLGSGVRFVQVGANDGVINDPIYRFIRWDGWTGIAVEPVPVFFEALCRNHSRNREVTPVNLAVGPEPGMLPFHYVPRRSGDPWWLDKIGSTSLDQVLKHEQHLPGLAKRVVRTEVPIVTFDELCRRHGIAGFDLLHLDVEGLDAALLCSVDFDRYQVQHVLFEHVHMSDDESADVRERLTGLGFNDRCTTAFDALWSR